MKKTIYLSLLLIITSTISIFSQQLDYSFAVVGCNRVDYLDTASTTGTAYSSGMSTANVYQLNRLFTDVSQISPLPKYLFLTGDIVMGYINDTVALAKQLNNWKLIYQAHPLSTSGIQLVVIPGNHETQDKAAGKKSFAAAERTFLRVMAPYIIGNNGPGIGGLDNLVTDQSKLTYSFNNGCDHFVVIDTDPVGKDGRVPYKWLANDIKNARAANARHIFALGHKPAYSSPLKPLDGLEAFIPERDSMWKYLENYQCDAMFAAHEHLWDTIHPHAGKTWQVIAGNGGSKVETTWMGAGQSYFGFTLISVYINNEVNLKSYGRDADMANYQLPTPGNLTTVRANFNIGINPVIEHTPFANNVTSGPFTFTATITDNISVNSAQLLFWVNGVSQSAVSPTNISGNIYTFVIPAQSGSGTINYYLKANDAALINFYSPSCFGSTHLFKFGPPSQIISNKYTWKSSPLLGSYQGINIYDGGFSGLHYIPGTNNEFFAITDRGPNLDANTNHHAISMGGANNNGKLFALPAFNPHLIRVKAQGDSLVYLSSTSIKRPDNSLTTGLTNPSQSGGTGEIALIDTAGTLGLNDVWGIDSEALTAGNNNDFWMSEEYGVSIWNTDNNGKVIKRYAPWANTPFAQAQDLSIDSIFKFRNANKGFEGVAFLPNEKVYGFLQNTLLFPASDANLKKNTRLHRFVEIDTRTNTTKMFGYEHDKVPSSGLTSSIKNDKRYIGDAVAINDHEMLILEHGKSATESYAKIYLIDITPATPINATNHLAYAGGTKSFEQLLDSTTAKTNGVTVVNKKLFLDLIANGYDASIEKQEGLTIINDTCIAIANDNDFGVISTNADGVISSTGIKSTIYVFSIPKSQKLNLCNNVSIAVSTPTICQGDSVLLSSTNVAGINYQWKKNDAIITTAQLSSYYAKESAVYELFATNANSCTAISNAKTITVNPNPTVSATSSNSLLCVGQSAVLTASSTAASFSWSDGATTMTTSVSPTTTTDYTITVNNGMCSTSAVITQSASTCTDTKTVDLDNVLSIYPNPFSSSFDVKWNANTIFNKEVSIVVYNVLGEVIYKQQTMDLQTTVNTTHWNNGTYFIKVNNKVSKLIKQN